MKPLNRTERNKAFFRFLLFFLVTITLIVTVVFFSIRVPFRENEEMRKTMFAMQRERAFSDSFAVAMRATVNELNKYESNELTVSAVRGQVENKINRMAALLKSVPNADNSIYTLMIDKMRDLNSAKMKLKEAKVE